MKANKQITVILSKAILLALFLAVFGTGGLPLAHAQMSVSNVPSQTHASELVGGDVLSDGQFVYGPNIGDFKVKNYLEANAPHLSNYADALYERSEYFSINPKIYLTLLEVHSHLFSAPKPALMEDPLGMNNGDLIAQIEYLSDIMSEAYYLHLYTYSSQPISLRTLKSFVTPSGITIIVAPDTNAGTYAIIAGLAAMNEKNISLILDNSQASGFYQTYRRLFENDDPLDETNHISIHTTVPDNLLQLSDAVLGAAAPDNLFQLPYLQGLSWKFGGVHNTGGVTTFTDASSLDFYPSGSTWGIDTSSMWVVAAASGIPTRLSDCGFKISHSGVVNAGWETTYYHLEGAKYLSGSINQNDKIGVIANTEAEATCTGGSASGPHVHFSLRFNGAYVAINGTPLSGWYVHSGRYSYDVDRNYMWLERAGVKKYAYSDLLVSEVPQVLSVTKAGTGSGTVTSSPPGINCGGSCSETYFSNTTVTLTVTPDAGSMFSWSGACSGTGSCILNMTDAKSAIAVFEPKLFNDPSRWTSSLDLSHGWTVADFVRTVGDVNGDGRADLVGFGLDGVYVALSNGTSFVPTASKWTSTLDQSHGWTVADFVRTVGDVNGDGRADLVGFGLDGVYVALSNGTSFEPVASKWTSSFDLSHGWTVKDFVRTVGDVNGDGKADLVGFGLDGVYVALSNGTSFEPVASKWTSSFDLSHGWTVKDFVRTVGDVNGDGKADLVGFGLDGVYVALSTGTSFAPTASKWTSSFDLSHGWTVKDFVRTVGDVNGDGKADLVGFGLNGVYVALSNGTSFEPAASRWTNDFDLSHGWTVAGFVRMVGDVNNEVGTGGRADLVGFGLDGVYIATATAR